MTGYNSLMLTTILTYTYYSRHLPCMDKEKWSNLLPSPTLSSDLCYKTSFIKTALV